MGMLLFTALTAMNAGRVHDTGTGAMWIAPELVAASTATDLCSQVASVERRELVFETLRPDDFDEELMVLAAPAREVVDFEWVPASSELRFSTTATTGVFSDLAPSSPADGPPTPHCGSR